MFAVQVLHLKKEVTKCVHFKSADESLSLVPEELFFKEVGILGYLATKFGGTFGQLDFSLPRTVSTTIC